MAEEEEKSPDEELGDFDSILGEAEEGGLDESGLGGDLDDIFGQEGGGEEASFGDEGGDSDLDNFFEDLSTIDDLELHEEDAEPAADGADMEEEVAAPPPKAEVEAPVPEKKKEKKPRKERKERGFISKMARWLIVLGILAGGGYYLYLFFFPEFPMPWEVVQEEKDKLISAIEERLKEPLLPPREEPPVAPPPPPKPRPVVRRAPKPVGEHGPWSLQIASCFFPSCLESYTSFLKASKRSVLVRKRTSRSESLEIYSISTLAGREIAQETADRINKNHPLEGHAYIYREKGGYRISMGAFGDLSRAKVVKEALNQQFFGDVSFTTRLKAFPYQVKSVLTGRYPTRSLANKALADLKDKQPRFKNAFVVRNR